MMPTETPQAVEWALNQDGVVIDGEIYRHNLVDRVRHYFNVNKIPYESFSYADLVPYLPQQRTLV